MLSICFATELGNYYTLLTLACNELNEEGKHWKMVYELKKSLFSEDCCACC